MRLVAALVKQGTEEGGPGRLPLALLLNAKGGASRWLFPETRELTQRALVPRLPWDSVVPCGQVPGAGAAGGRCGAARIALPLAADLAAVGSPRLGVQ